MVNHISKIQSGHSVILASSFGQTLTFCSETRKYSFVRCSIDNPESTITFNHFSTTGLYSGPAHYDVSIRQAAIEAFVRSSFKIFLVQTFPRCGATCYILPSRAMSQLFNGVNSVSLRGTFCRYLRWF